MGTLCSHCLLTSVRLMTVPRQALWQVLEKSSVPPRMLNIIKSLHEGMQAEVRVGDSRSGSFQVRNGLRQGCTLAPTLFSIYFSAVVANWHGGCSETGGNVLFQHRKKLVGDKTAKSRLCTVRVTESQFADDAALYAGFRKGLESMTTTFVEEASKWGLTVSLEKTKGMAMGEGLRNANVTPILVEGGEIEIVDNFTYLGSVISKDGYVTNDVKGWNAKASRAFGCLRGPVFHNSVLSVATRRAVYKAVVLAVLLYGAETWTLNTEHVRCLNSSYNCRITTILGVTKYQQWEQRLTSKILASKFGMEWSIPNAIMDKQLKWLGHLGRMDDERLAKKLLFREIRKRRACHGPKKRWRDWCRWIYKQWD